MPEMTDARELVMHELGDILHAENMLVKALPTMAQEAGDDELRAGFTRHLEETRGQVERLEKAFVSLGEKAKAEQCPGIEGIIAEHDEFMSENAPSPDVCDLFLTGAGARAEHYEIAAYSGLITMARALKERECVDLLTQNLREEKEALKSLEKAARPPVQGAGRRSWPRDVRRAGLDGGVRDRHPVDVRAYRDGPIVVRGPFALRDRSGAPIAVRRRTVALCRCGRSRLGTFCDGTHKAVGFRAPAEPPWSPGDGAAGEGDSRTVG